MSGELSRGEFIRKLNGRSSQEVCELRDEIFNEVVGKDLAKDGDKLVMRRKIGGRKTLSEGEAYGRCLGSGGRHYEMRASATHVAEEWQTLKEGAADVSREGKRERY